MEGSSTGDVSSTNVIPGGRIRWKRERERRDEEREREDRMARYGTNGATHGERKV